MLSSMQGELGVMARNICMFHHERYDGKGYWHKYSGELPLYVPIVTLTDVFVALINERSYKQAWPPHEAIDYIQKNAGAQFCPELAKVFISLIGSDSRIPAIFNERQEQNI
jgi:putative two-component system response regulator